MKRNLAPVHYNRAQELERNGRYEEAAKSYEEAVRLDPADIDAQVKLGLLLRELGRDDEANRAFQVVLALKCRRSPVRVGSGARWQLPLWSEVPEFEDSGTIGS